MFSIDSVRRVKKEDKEIMIEIESVSNNGLNIYNL